MSLNSIEEAVEDIRQGKMVILVDDEDRENYKLILAKHRNGPTGEISMYFKADRTKFYETETQRE